ncbi:hypothetical protein SAMN04487949_1305 [Halogranum gelatinilyticum]|uniref:Uncharacterized protein n=1 Tax=Halogranum gelatinilyticum TaxID=660521 RepID=A0A1G9REF0_9EURY|nr:hypothetical protein [Halogranum gelatinilyticum]SDM21638.1 hypothetical protein SAMN04487949_1305 [Halogranum gelatinilyticum]
MSLHDRLRPWHALMVAVFVLGSGLSLFRAGDYAVAALFEAVVSGLFAVVVFQFTVGNLWGYAVEYRNAGGRWTDPVFVAPFAVALALAALVAVWTGEPVSGAWAGFWVFAVAAALLAVGVSFVAGYRNPEA